MFEPAQLHCHVRQAWQVSTLVAILPTPKGFDTNYSCFTFLSFLFVVIFPRTLGIFLSAFAKLLIFFLFFSFSQILSFYLPIFAKHVFSTSFLESTKLKVTCCALFPHFNVSPAASRLRLPSHRNNFFTHRGCTVLFDR